MKPPWPRALAGYLSAAVPLCLALFRASSVGQWNGDRDVVRGLGLIPDGVEGPFSSVFFGIAASMPLGSRSFRLSVVGALAIAAAGRLVFSITCSWLEAQRPEARFTPALGLLAALGTTSGTVWQLEATVPGGAAVAAALGLACGAVVLHARRDARLWLCAGSLFGLALLESPLMGFGLILATVGMQLTRIEPATLREAKLFAVGVGVASFLASIPMLIRPFSQGAWLHFGHTLLSASPSFEAAHLGPTQAWLTHFGLLVSVAGVGGVVYGMSRATLRKQAMFGVVLMGVASLWPSMPMGHADSRMALWLVAAAFVWILTSIALGAAVQSLRQAPIPMARPAAVLLASFPWTLILASAEDAGQIANAREKMGADVWAKEALDSLPSRSLIVVRSPATLHRLWAEQLVGGSRPDVVVVPGALLGRGSVARQMLDAEPALAPLVRDIAILGRPTEYALTRVADTRPLYLELDDKLDPRLFDHIVPEAFFLRFLPHAVGRSDRQTALRASLAAPRRVLLAARQTTPFDSVTVTAVSAYLRDKAAVLGALGDRENCRTQVDLLRRMQPSHGAIPMLERYLENKGPRLDVAILPSR